MELTKLKSMTDALAALDFSAENEAIAGLEAHIAEYQAAIGRAEERCTEIARSLHEGARPDGRAVAEALLADTSAQAAAIAGPNREQMETERAALRDGIGDLRHRVENARIEINRIRSEAISKAGGIAQPLADEILRQAREAVAVLPSLYAALVAISEATKTSTFGANGLREVIYTAQGTDRLIPYSRTQDIPVEIVKALQPLSEKGAALRDARFPASIGMP